MMMITQFCSSGSVIAAAAAAGAVATVLALLQPELLQQEGPPVMLPRLCRKGRYFRAAAASHTFLETQPKKGLSRDP